MKQLSLKLIEKAMRYLERIFLTGILTIVPIAFTIFIFVFSFKLVHRWLSPLHDYLPSFLQCIPYSEFIFVVAIILSVGLVVNIFLLHSLIHGLERLVGKIPLVRPVYSGLKQIVSAFTSTEKSSFQQVVLIEFPRVGAYSIGFMTGHAAPKLSPQGETGYVNVFIPTTPNPTTGFFVLVREQELIRIELTRQEAMALIISGGIIQPEKK